MALLGSYLEFILMRIEVSTQVSITYLYLVAKRVWVYVNPPYYIACVIASIIFLYFLRIDAYPGSDETAQVLLCDRGTKLVFEPDRAHAGLLQSHPVPLSAWPRIRSEEHT